MGIFSKKSVICEKCGKEYQTRFVFETNICSECNSKDEKRKEQVEGYAKYAKKVLRKRYTEEQLEQIATHREQLLEKYRMLQGISRTELQNVSKNYKKLADEQAADALIRMANSSIEATMGASYSSNFFIPTAFENLIVDAQDVFAVGYTNAFLLQDHKEIWQDGLNGDRKEMILCAVFTNDPYIPVFPMIYTGKLGMLELFKSKKGRAGVAIMFEEMCPNLTYPVQDIKELKKQIKETDTVKGNIEKNVMLDMISNVSLKANIFELEKIQSDLPDASVKMLEEYGYLQEELINQILKMDKMFNRNYWNKQIKKLSESNK